MKTSIAFMTAFCILAVGGQAAEPQPPKIKTLIVDGFSNHDWAHTTAPIRAVLEPTQRFQVAVATCPPTPDGPAFAAFRPRFADYDVVIQNCNDHAHSSRWPAAVRADFVQYVRQGGGVFIFHSANNAFADWPDYDRIIGLGCATSRPARPSPWTPTARSAAFRPARARARRTARGGIGSSIAWASIPSTPGCRRPGWPPNSGLHLCPRPGRGVASAFLGQDPATHTRWPIEWTVSFGKGRVYNSTFGTCGAGESDPPGMRGAGFQTILVLALQWLPAARSMPPCRRTSPAKRNPCSARCRQGNNPARAGHTQPKGRTRNNFRF